MQPMEYCRQKARQSGSSFLAGFRFLSPQQKDAMTALYAFCRELDDVVDDCSDRQTARTTLQWWRADLRRVFAAAEMPEHPVCQALKTVFPAGRGIGRNHQRHGNGFAPRPLCRV